MSDDKIVINTRIFFGLVEPLALPGIKIDSANIKIITNAKKNNSIIGFEVIIPDSNDEKLENAYHEIRRLCNYLSLKTGRSVDHKRPETFIVRDGVTTSTVPFTTDSLLIKQLDIDLNGNQFSEIVAGVDPVLTQQLSDVASGIKAFDDRNFKDAIKNLWLSIENENHGLTKDYQSLRDGLSHSEINNQRVISNLPTDFGIILKEKPDSLKIPKGSYIDTDNPTNREILKREANILREKAIKLLENKASI